MVFVSFRAQGSLEYLLVIGLVVLISAVVIMALPGLMNSPASELPEVNNALSGLRGNSGWSPIVVNTAEINPNANGMAYISLRNGSGAPLNILGISASSGGRAVYQSFGGGGGGSGNYSLPVLDTVCQCNGAPQTTCDLNIAYLLSGSVNYLLISQVFDCNSSSVLPDLLVSPGAGTVADPWLIVNCAGLQNINSNPGGNYLLYRDIDCSESSQWNGGAGFVPLGSYAAPFSGSLDGAGHVVSGLYINRPDLTGVGLFGVDSPSASVTNLSLSGANVTGYDNVGGMFGELLGSTSDDFVVNRIEVWGNPLDSQVGNAVGVCPGGVSPGISVTVPDGMYFGNQLGDFGSGCQFP